MSKEQEASEDKAVVTDDMLSSAADAADNAEEGAEETTEETTGEETTEETSEEETTREETTEETSKEETTEETTEEETTEETLEEPESAADRSRLGRKVKKLETLLSTALDRIESLSGPGATKEQEVDQDALEDDDFVKASDIPKILQAEKRKEQTARTAYDSSFLSKVLEIGTNEGMDETLQDEIFEEMQKNFNNFDRTNPGVDAEINFRKAHVAVIQRQAGAKPKNPLKGGKSKVATGVGGATDTKVVAAKPVVKLDAHAAAFIADTGGSVEKASEVLAGTSKAHLNFNRG